MKAVVLSILALLCGGASATAADMAVKARPVAAAPLFNWTGFYLGGFVGAAGANRNASASEPINTAGFLWNGPLVVQDTPYDLGSSVIGGATIGYNWQQPNSSLVLGIESEFGYLHLHGSRQDVNAVAVGFAYPDSVNSTTLGDWYGIVAGRAGWAANNALFYLKGGVAFVNNSYLFDDSCTSIAAGCGGGAVRISHSDVQITYAVGAGLEYAVNSNWSIKGEYLYLGTEKTYVHSGVPNVGLPLTNTSSNPGVHTGKFGFNYRFGATESAKY